MPEDDYSPFWHIGFANWLTPSGEVIKGLDRLKELRAAGKVEIREWPAVAAAGPNPGLTNDFDFDTTTAPHVVNCPTPVTIDTVVHRANKKLKLAQP